MGEESVILRIKLYNPVIPLGLVQPCEIHKPGLTTGPGNIPVTQPALFLPLVSEASKSILCPLEISHLQEGHLLWPQLYSELTRPSSTAPGGKRNQALVLGKGRAARRWGQEAGVGLTGTASSLYQLLSPCVSEQTLRVIDHGAT